MNLSKCIKDMLARGVVTLSNGALKMRKIQCEFLAGKIGSGLEHVESYDFTSEPKAEGLSGAFS